MFTEMVKLRWKNSLSSFSTFNLLFFPKINVLLFDWFKNLLLALSIDGNSIEAFGENLVLEIYLNLIFLLVKSINEKKKKYKSRTRTILLQTWFLK